VWAVLQTWLSGGALSAACLLAGGVASLCLGVGALAVSVRMAELRSLLAGDAEALARATEAGAAADHRAVAAESDLRRLRHALEACPSALVITDLAGRVVYANPAYGRLMGCEPRGIMEHTVHVLHDQTLTAAQEKSLRQAMASGSDWHGDYWDQDGRGQVLFLHVLMTGLAGGTEEAAPDRLLFAFENGTDKRRLQEKFLHAQKMEIVGRLAGGVVHDLSNMLTVIMGFAQIVQGQLPADHPLYEDVDEIVRVTERASTLNRQLLTFARTRAHHAERVELDAAVQEMDRFLQRTLGEDVTLRLDLCAGAAATTIDPGQLNQLLMNLAVNARDAMPRGGALTLATAVVDLPVEFCRRHTLRPGRYLRLTVRDTGVGMTPEVLERLFEPFFTTKAEGKGTGLGLSTVHEIVTRFRGCIEVTSQLDIGTQFEIHLPVSKIDSTAPDPTAWETVPGGTETILVVEDDPDVRRLTGLLLRGLGYRVLLASNGREALTLSTTEADTLDLLVADVIMPEMNGIDLAAKLRTLAPHIGVILITGFAEHPIVLRATHEQFDCIIQKPFNRSRLATAIRSTLETQRAKYATPPAADGKQDSA
jgi:PAS domain S-box-containing protein